MHQPVAWPSDVWLMVSLHLDLPSIERLFATCRALRALGDDSAFAFVARSWYGAEFWEMALSRDTAQKYTSMRAELRSMHDFDCTTRRLGASPWTAVEYAAWWKYEADYRARRRSSSGAKRKPSCGGRV